MDNRESKGRETLLQVTKWEPNALVSSLKELIEPSLRPSNHLIATGLRLDRNTLHIIVLWVNSHSLIEEANMPYKVWYVII